mmetsp:Transcript_3725/g.6907  ORF Transcript_3725/g.6907 Transcript_3725/m.6907 type:complete len:280 (-) Transcript_3725:57-896(-)
MILTIRNSDISLKNLRNSTLPETRARDWLVDDTSGWVCDNFYGNSDKKKDLEKRYILALFYYSLNGDNWMKCSANETVPCHRHVRYLDKSDECEWFGNTCNKYGELVKLSMSTNNLDGTLPHLLGELSHLESINLDSNKIKGSIPISLLNLPQLKRLYMDDNQLIGTIPSELYNAKALEVLDIDENWLTGSISSQIGDLTRLQYISLKSNLLTGKIPEKMGSLNELKILLLHGNEFVGIMPSSVCDLFKSGKLQHLQADCGMPQIEIKCTCCTRCYPYK